MLSLITVFLFYSNFLILVFTLFKGFRKIKKIQINRPLLLLPLFSLIQIVFTEFVFFFEPIANGQNTYILFSIDLYSILEFIIIYIFLYRIFSERNKQIFILSLLVLGLITLLVNSILEPSAYFLNLTYLKIYSGISIESLLLLKLFDQIKKITISSLYTNPAFMTCLGLFILYMLVWPSSLLNDIILKDYYGYHLYLSIFNSLGYSIFYILFLISINAENK